MHADQGWGALECKAGVRLERGLTQVQIKPGDLQHQIQPHPWDLRAATGDWGLMATWEESLVWSPPEVGAEG